MIDKPLKQLNAFFKIAEEQNLAANDQLLYLHLFNRFNKAHWCETLNITDKDLLASMRLHENGGKSASTYVIRSARKHLSNAGLIEFTSGNGATATEYKLLPLYAAEKNVESPAEVVPQNVLQMPAQTNLSQNSPEVLKAWHDNKGEKLAGAKAFALIQDEILYGSEKIIATIITASTENNYDEFPNVTYKYFKTILENSLKGEKTNARRNARNGARPVQTVNYSKYDIIDE